MKRDPRLIRLTTFFFPLLRIIFRIRFIGLEKIPSESCLLISNHNIGSSVEILALLWAWEKRFNYSRPVYGLAHRVGFRLPIFSTVLEKLGAVPGDYESADEVFRSNGYLIIFPGGNWEAVRPFSERNRSDFGGKRGWIKIAKFANKKIVPIAISGSHGVNPVLARSRMLAKVLFVERLFGIKWFPVTVGQIIWCSIFVIAFHYLPVLFLIWGIITVFIATPLIPVFPSKITISFCDPIDPVGADDEIYKSVEKSISARL